MILEFETIQLVVLFVSFFGVALWESFRPRRTVEAPVGRRWATIFGLFLVNTAVLAVALPEPGDGALASLGLALVAPHGWPVQLAAAAAGFVLLDLLHYLHHRVMHAVPFLWRMHAIHHSDRDVDVATTYLHHPVENIIFVAVLAVGVSAAGFPGIVLLAYGLVSTVMAPLQHGNVALPPALERALSLVFVTGSLHRVHHSTEMDEGNSNFGVVFSWWDRLFRTLRTAPAVGQDALTFGVAEIEGPGRQGFLALVAAPFRMAVQPSPSPR